MKEIWKDIPNYEGIYQASTKGNIRTLPNKTTSNKMYEVRKWKTRVLKFKTSNHATGGKRVDLWLNGKPRTFLVHRLVATTFLDNLIETKMTVNHKDGNRLNNSIENLEWLSKADNIRHGFENGMYPQQTTEITDKETLEITICRSMSVAGQFIGRSESYISGSIKRNKYENDKYKWKKV